MGWHADSFDKASVAKFEHVFARSINGDLSVNKGEFLKGIFLCQPLAKGSRHIAHGVKRSAMVPMNPFVYLFGSESGEPPGFNEAGELGKGECHKFVIHRGHYRQCTCSDILPFRYSSS